MNYLHIIASMDPRTGGPCQGIRNLTPRTHEQGNSVEVVCLDDPNSGYLAQETVRIHALGQGRGSWCYHPALRPWLEANLHRFDAVILNGLWQYPGYTMARLAKRPDAPPYFVFPHGMLDPWFQRAPERRWKAIRNWFYWKLVEQFVIQRAAAVFFTCAEEMRLGRDTFSPYRPQREINVGYGVGSPPAQHEGMKGAFQQKCPGLNDRPYFLFLSRIHPKKGLEAMIRGYAAVYGTPEARGQRPAPTSDLSTLNSQPSTFPALVIAGPGLDTEYGKKMQQLAEDLCRSNTVFWPGMLTGDAKWGALYHTEAFVLTSHQENFGIAVAESLACGKPVLISNQINIWQEIEADQAGLVSDDTFAGAAQLFRRWESMSPDERMMMARAAQASYENRFGIAGVAENLIATMGKLVAETRK